MVSPYLKSEVVQVNTIIANDSIFKLNESNTINYFTIKTAAIGPVEDDLTGGIVDNLILKSTSTNSICLTEYLTACVSRLAC